MQRNSLAYRNYYGVGDWLDSDPRGDFASNAYLSHGSRIQWRGEVAYKVPSHCWFCTASGVFQEAIEARGFIVEKIDFPYEQKNGKWQAIVVAITPYDYANVNDAGSIITSAAWEVFGNVYSAQAGVLWNAADIARANAPQQGRGNNQTNDKPKPPGKCDDKEGLEWLSCKLGFDSTAQQLGLGIGSGVTLSLAVLFFLGIVILKK